jgi:hypothetical protein
VYWTDDDDIEDEASLEPASNANANLSREERYFRLLTTALAVCTTYKPKFGKDGKQGLSLAEFQSLYSSDPFYHWVGLDSPLIYAAHKAAGGITSVYRQ